MGSAATVGRRPDAASERAADVVILDGLATSVAALSAARLEPAIASHLIAGQRSRERAHAPVLQALGLEPLLDLRIRAGEGAGAALAAGVLRAGLEVRTRFARTAPRSGASGTLGHPGSDVRSR